MLTRSYFLASLLLFGCLQFAVQPTLVQANKSTIQEQSTLRPKTRSVKNNKKKLIAKSNRNKWFTVGIGVGGLVVGYAFRLYLAGYQSRKEEKQTQGTPLEETQKPAQKRPRLEEIPSPIPIVIIGSGPAGYTAALYAARANLKPVLFQGPEPGGQLELTTDVENYPGYPEGRLGPDMMKDFEIQAEQFGAIILPGTITEVDFRQRPFSLTIDKKNTIKAHTVIIATGASAKWLGIPGEDELNGKGVSACAVCDGFFSKGKDVAVVGGGDSAAGDALYLSKLCPKVYLLVRKPKMRATEIMRDRVEEKTNIQVYYNTEAKKILGEDGVTGVRIINNQTEKENTLDIAGFFVAIGHTPNIEPFPSLEKTEKGYIKTKPKSTETNIAGVFACGDIQDHVYRQAITAGGTGCMAAMDAERFLEEKGLTN